VTQQTTMQDTQRTASTADASRGEIGATARGGEIMLPQAREYARAISSALRTAARKARSPVPVLSGGGGFKARRGDRLFFRGIILSFILVFALPFVAASIYLPFFAADQYASEARFAVRSRKASPVSSILGMAAGGGSRQMQDTQIIADFLQSRAIVDELETRFNLREIFAPRGFDFLFSFARENPKEKLVRFWKRQVSVGLDRGTGIMSVEVRAFRAEDALAICTALVEISERMVNDLTERARKDALSHAESELARNEQRLEEATTKMRDIRNREGVLDADAQAVAITEVVTKLRLTLVKVEQEAESIRGQLSADAPQLRYLSSQAKALRDKIAEYSRMIASSQPGDGRGALSASANALDRQKIEVKVAQEQYAASISAFESARSELETQGSFLLTFLKPRLAEEAEYPKRWMLWLTVLVPAAILWAFMLGFALLIRDHMPS
jgi:capsular polysaccharide transport system permease protein